MRRPKTKKNYILDGVLRKDLITDHVTIVSDIYLQSNNALPIRVFPSLPFHIGRVAIAVDQFALAFNCGLDLIRYWSLTSHLSVWCGSVRDDSWWTAGGSYTVESSSSTAGKGSGATD